MSKTTMKNLELDPLSYDVECSVDIIEPETEMDYGFANVTIKLGGEGDYTGSVTKKQAAAIGKWFTVLSKKISN